MSNPECLIKNGAAAFVASQPQVSITAGETIIIKLNSPSGVSQWEIECISTDETSDKDAINASLTVNTSLFEATFTAPAAGKAMIFQSRVNQGRNAQREIDPSLVSRFKLVVPAANGNLVLALGETTEGDLEYGWLATMNEFIRNPSGGGGGGGSTLDVSTYDASTQDGDVITRSGARMFVHMTGNFATGLILPFPTVGDEIFVKATGLSGGTSILTADPTRLLDGQGSYRFTADNQGLHLVYVGSGQGWKIASHIGVPGVLTLSGAGPFDDVDVTGYRAIRFTNAAAVNLRGMVAPPPGVHGRVSIISTNGVTMKHEDTNSAAANRIKFASGSDRGITPNYGIESCYDHTDNRWRIDGYPDG